MLGEQGHVWEGAAQRLSTGKDQGDGELLPGGHSRIANGSQGPCFLGAGSKEEARTLERQAGQLRTFSRCLWGSPPPNAPCARPSCWGSPS